MTGTSKEVPPVVAPPPSVGVIRAMVWHWKIVVVSMVLLGGVGAALGLLRTPSYTATSRLTVGRIDISSPGALSGFALATESLATSYSRTATALAVAKHVSAKTGISVSDVQGHVTATPVPESPVFKIEAEAPNQKQAVELANATSHALMAYVTKLNRSNPDSKRLFVKYGAAASERRHAEAKLKVAEEEAGETKTSPAVVARKAKLEVATLRAEALGSAYKSSVQSQTATELIQVISPATEASSDRRSTFVIYVFIGLLAGLLVGGAIAYVRATR
jgi:capsular polysaccharide biosynthesis protein